MLNKLLIAAGISTFCLLLPAAKIQAYPERPLEKDLSLSQQDSEAAFAETLKKAAQLHSENDPVSWRQAIATFEETLALLPKVDVNQAETQGLILYLIGDCYRLLGEQLTALDYFQQALALRKAAGDRTGEEATLQRIGSTYEFIGNSEAAIDYYQQALTVAVEIADRDRQMGNLNSLGTVYSALGETDTALDYYQQVLALDIEAENVSVKAATLNNIGSIYESLGSEQQALNYYQQALQSVRDISEPIYTDTVLEATTLNNIGNIYDSLADKGNALSYFNQAGSIYEEIGDLAGVGGVLNNIGSLYDLAEEQETALTYYLQALPILQSIGKRDREAATLNNIGYAYSLLEEQEKGLEYYRQALAIFEEIGDRNQQAIALSSIAFVQKDQGKLEDALDAISAAVDLVEDLRTNISNSDLRTSYFATVQDLYQLKTDLLMQLGRPEEAFEVSEAARARLLIELLNEASVDLRAEANPKLIAQEIALRQKLQAIENQRIELSIGSNTKSIAAALEVESEATVAQLEQTLVEIKRDSPAYAEIVQPSPLSIQQIRQTVLDDETVLLQYALGKERSYLWVIDANQSEVYTLPGKAAIKEAASSFLNIIATTKDSSASTVARVGKALTTQVLPELPSWTAGKRLLISGDGVLSKVPFGALPLPESVDYRPLLVEHEVLSQPSISAVAVLRQQLANRQEQPLLIAVLADPVYDATDPRVTRQQAQPNLLEIVRLNLRDLDQQTIQPLPYTRIEAENILAIASDFKTTAAYDFNASYDWITDPAIGDYSILHLATHGFFNPKNPQLSGVTLSLVDANGSPSRQGFLQLHDIFNLELSAELVVLSACATGLGKNVGGEGIIGLSRGFMYAGAERVMVSLWNVSDQGTAELMSHFYRALIEDELTPAAALRTAQKAQWEAGRRPHQWAAFTIQGEWQ